MDSQKRKKNSSMSSKSRPAPPGQGKSKSARRRRAARNLTKSAGVARAQRTMTFGGNQVPVLRAADTGLRRLNRTPRSGLSDQGVAFLKCAFAPPDFQATSIGGVPDDFRGPTLTRKHRYVGQGSFGSSIDYYILLLPIPGFAYWQASTTAGLALTNSTVWTGVPYGDFQSMFGSNELLVANQVNRFRFVSNHFELIPTVNQMVWSGNIQAFKIPVQFIDRPPSVPTTGDIRDQYAITGLDGSNGGSMSNMYTGQFIMGLYTACYSSNPDFLFTSILENFVSPTMPLSVGNSDFGQLNFGATGAGAFPGLDNGFESMCIKISGVSATESCIIKTWACVEYQVLPTSVLYAFIALSPCDELAMKLYREIILELPVGVPFDQNDGFWKRVLGIINTITGAGSYLPGPYGLASRGLNLLGRAGQSFLS